MTGIRTVIVDDEPLARSRLRRLLDRRRDVEVVAECNNGADAVRTLKQLRPELVFLDVQMPDLDGFQVLDRLPARSRPVVIFVTAYDRYALRAFDVHAIDYLLKPFDNERFHEAVELALEQLRLRQGAAFQARLDELLGQYRSGGEVRQSVPVKRKGAHIPVPLAEVSHVRAAGNYVTLYRRGEEILYRTTMNAFEEELDPARFLRIHRSAMVNVEFIRDLRYLNNNRYRFVMADGEELISGRSYKQRVADHVARTEK